MLCDGHATRRHKVCVGRMGGGVTLCICSVLLLNTVPVLQALCMILFLYAGGKCTDVFGKQCSIVSSLFAYPAVTNTCGMPILGSHGPHIVCIARHLVVCSYVVCKNLQP